MPMIRLFLYLKWMYDTKYITTDDFKNIVEKYKEKKCLIKWKCEHEELLKEIGEKVMFMFGSEKNC